MHHKIVEFECPHIICYNILQGGMAMTKISEAQKKASQKYLEKFEDIKFRVPKGKREIIKKAAIEKGYKGLQPYIINLIEKDTGIKLK